jgi:hypothetical protein
MNPFGDPRFHRRKARANSAKASALMGCSEADQELSQSLHSESVKGERALYVKVSVIPGEPERIGSC